MRFAPEYVACVLNENFEDAKTLLLSPMMAINYAHLVMLDAQGIVPREAAHACKLLQIPKVVPMHFGTFPPLTGRPDELQKLVGHSTQVWALEPGKPVNW